jgi:hypothetical protein
VYDGGWQPKATNEPASAVTLCPMVIVDGAVCASRTAPEATFPVTLMTACAATEHKPGTVMLA